MPRLKPTRISPTPAENARIRADIAADPDAFELDADWFARARPAAEVAPHLVEGYLRQRGKGRGVAN